MKPKESGHLSYACPKNMLGEREPPKKKEKKKKKKVPEPEEEMYVYLFLLNSLMCCFYLFTTIRLHSEFFFLNDLVKQ
jgi:hypothetical protein